MGSFNIFVCLLLSSAVQTHASKHCCKCCAPNATAVGAHTAIERCEYNGLPDRCLTRYGVEADCTEALRTNDVLAKKAFPQCYEMTSPPPTAAGTTTMTAVDSSASSGSGASSASLASFGSGPGDSSSGYSSGSFNQGSFGSDPSGSASSGSTASGSFGSQLPIWLWIVLLLCCCCLAGAGGAMGGKKSTKKKKSKKSAPAAPAPVAEVLPEVEPLMSIPPLMPLATTGMMMPSYQMIQQPMTTSYAAPMTTSYAAPMSYAQPAAGYNFASTGQVI